MSLDLDALRFDEKGLMPVVVQHAATGAVLMLAFADREAVARTVATGEVWFWSRSRQGLWKKGETSGNVLRVASLYADCDGDSLLVRAWPAGPTCHRGTASCFDGAPASLELGWLAEVVASRRAASPESSYTARLLAEGLDRVAQKVGEEGVETALAAVRHGPGDPRLASEAADLLYHLVVLLEATSVGLPEVAEVLVRRAAQKTRGGER
ncbi:MAG TPA: bifunctional phosphoribosyl-AMP cyclohydrolase/phosphoribosyl-ATP diphosphatase HisIE [Thermoanaerobaculia bacterium]|nr:bifunctional phosphoribosyl-AMP cyclohydrolase/phosphoribosyl-ATP diphosphatase HisIE [Thermoanaerobaculia bacterium]